ncbi:hypothetical protein BASA83_006627 [Batrachochytrium salamandrivorans]|nr:hypothetical protein BASA83_006627 [Batrachochytrium salamandrivorans]
MAALEDIVASSPTASVHSKSKTKPCNKAFARKYTYRINDTIPTARRLRPSVPYSRIKPYLGTIPISSTGTYATIYLMVAFKARNEEPLVRSTKEQVSETKIRALRQANTPTFCSDHCNSRPTTSNSNDMDIDFARRGPLTTAERRQRFSQDFVLLCILVSALSSLKKLLLPGTLRLGPLSHVDTFFVDCGADDLFMDSKLAADLQIPLLELSTSITLRLADGDSPLL